MAPAPVLDPTTLCEVIYQRSRKMEAGLGHTNFFVAPDPPLLSTVQWEGGGGGGSAGDIFGTTKFWGTIDAQIRKA